MQNSTFEDKLTDVWGITHELRVVVEGLLEKDASRDQIANMLIGLADLYDLKMERLFDAFEEKVREGAFAGKPAQMTPNFPELTPCSHANGSTFRMLDSDGTELTVGLADFDEDGQMFWLETPQETVTVVLEDCELAHFKAGLNLLTNS